MTDLPSSLIQSIRDQRAVLFLGAGANHKATHPHGKTIPQGSDLRDIICDQFLSGQLKDKPLVAVSTLASNEAGATLFHSFIRTLFEPFGPASHHLIIPTFRWRAIVTTNFDLLIERAYEQAPSSLQTLVKSVKDGDNFDTRLHKDPNPVGYYKLHGCIDHCHDPQIPLILGTEQYARYEAHRTRFYARFRDLGFEYPIVFAGYSISDPHIQRILFDLTDPTVGRPPYFLLSPGITDVEARYWASNRVTPIDITFQDFLEKLDTSITSAARSLPIGMGGGDLSIRKHYRTPDVTESPLLTSYLSNDVTHVHSALTAPMQNPKNFYRGYDDGWGCILQNLDARRSFADSVLVDAVLLSEEERQPVELFVLKGPGGNGKTVSLKRIAWETGVTYDQLALYVHGPAGIQLEALEEISRLTKKRIFLFVDRLALLRDQVRDLLDTARTRAMPLSVIGTERYNEWNIYCEQLEPFVRHEFPVRYLSEKEIKDLLELLERHGSLGLLQGQSPQARIEAFTKGAERQLLVALHETTLGVPFEEIIIDEYRRIDPPAARSLYLSICALHQFGAPIRAGLISRATGIGFEQFHTEFLAPLDHVVHVVRDNHSLDMFYSCRHQHVAEMVFGLVLTSPEDKFDHLVDILGAVNVDYSSDRETFTRLIRGRRIAEMFPGPELGRLFYDHVEQAVPGDAFVLHQRAVFEMQHRGGSLVLADEVAKRAYELNSGSYSIQHTQSEIARRLANETVDPLRKQALRRKARVKLGGRNSRPSEYDLNTRARLAVDEVVEIVGGLNEAQEDATPVGFLDAVKEAEMAVQRALQLFPESPEILATEAIFRDQLNQESRAQMALERAFNLNPRQDWLAVRLARRFVSNGDIASGRRVLETCLRDNPGSKIAHLQLGRILASTEEGEGALEHLRRSFNAGDSNFEGQFWYARELFVQGQMEESDKLFAAINRRAPGRYRTGAGASVERDGVTLSYDGQVRRKEDGYAFIRLVRFARDVFASRAESEGTNWEQLELGLRVRCGLAFSRRGSRAITVQLSS